MATLFQTNVTSGLATGLSGQRDEDGELVDSDRANERHKCGAGTNQQKNPPTINASAVNNRVAPVPSSNVPIPNHTPYPGQPQQDLCVGQPLMGPASYGYA